MVRSWVRTSARRMWRPSLELERQSSDMAVKAGGGGRRPAGGASSVAGQGGLWSAGKSRDAAPVLVSAEDLAAVVEGFVTEGDRDAALRIRMLESRLSAFTEQLRTSRSELAAERAVARALEAALATERTRAGQLGSALAEKETQWLAASAALQEIQPALDEAAVNSALLDGSYIWKLIRPVVRLEVRARGLVRKVSRRRRRIEEDAAEVAASGLFDRTWYLEHYQDVTDSRIDPLRHYLLHGAPEGRDPGPSFSSSAYLEAYPDVVAVGLNPLLHYARYGRAEGRAVFPSRLAGGAVAAQAPAATAATEEAELAVLRASDLFDAAWYLANNSDVAAVGADPALHYLRYGGQEGRDPGPRFSSGTYLTQNPDVAKGGTNPLLHYLRFGAVEGRALTATLASEPALPAPLPHSVAMALPASDALLPRDAWAGDDGDAVFGVGGVALGSAAPASRAASGLMADLRLLRHLSGPRARGLAWLQRTGETKQALGEGEDVAASEAPALRFRSADAPTFVDAAIDGGARVRFRLDASGAEGQVVTCVQFGTAGLVLLGECLVSEGFPAFADISLADGFLPVLVVVTDRRGRLVDSCLLPFPSLLRGGSHHGEALASYPDQPGLEAVRRVTLDILAAAQVSGFRPAVERIEVDLSGGTGAERIFDRGLRAWLGDVLGISIGAVPSAAASDGARWLAEAAVLTPGRAGHPAPDAAVLRVPVDGVPSLQVLFRGPGPGEGPFGAFVAVRLCDATPSWVVTPPAGATLDDMQPTGLAPFPRFLGPLARPSADGEARPWPAALRFVDPLTRQGTEWVAPFAPELPVSTLVGPVAAAALTPEPAVSVVLPCGTDAGPFAAVLEALAFQQGLRGLQVIAVATAETAPDMLPALRRHFPHSGHLVLSGAETALHAQYNRAVELAEADLLVVLGERVLLHDARTLSAFAALLAQPGVSSVGCPLLAVSSKKREDRIQLADGGRHALPLSQKEAPPSATPLLSLLAALPPAVWPLAAPSGDFFMVRRHDWIRQGGFKPAPVSGGLPATPFWEARARESGLHLMTFALSASLLAVEGAAPKPAHQDRIALSAGHEASLAARRIVA